MKKIKKTSILKSSKIMKIKKDNNTDSSKNKKIKKPFFIIVKQSPEISFKRKEKASKSEIKKSEKLYAQNLEKENARLMGELKTKERQLRRELLSYLVPIQSIYSNVNFNTKNQQLSYINTQLNHFFQEKNYRVFKPNLMEMHDKETMIVEGIVETKDSCKEGLIANVILVGIKEANDKVLLPAEVRIYKCVRGKK